MSAKNSDSGIASQTGRYPALDAMRGVAVLMVVYDHLFAVGGERFAGNAFPPANTVRNWVSTPLGIIQDFGWFGVCLFFLISGFVITHSARRENIRTFFIRRIFRIGPPFAAAVLLVALLDFATGVQRPWLDYFYGLTLVGYFTVPQIIVLGVAWTLVIEVIFYALMAAISPLLKGTRPLLGVALASTLVWLVILWARDFGPSFFLFAASVAYLPVLLIGSTIYLRKATSADMIPILLLASANAAVFMLGLRSIHTAFLPISNSYPVTLVYALAVFLMCVDLGAPNLLRRFGDISYSLYLLHGTLGFFVVQHALSAGMANASPWVASLVCIAASYVMYHTVERPAINLGKRLSNGGPGSAGADFGAQQSSSKAIPREKPL